MKKRILVATVLACTATQVFALDVKGSVGLEGRYFIDEPSDPRQHGNNASINVLPELYQEWADGQQSLVFSPYLRWDQGDSERSHADIRELTWSYIADEWELRAGLRKVFWGVTESQHLVDVINQTDMLEDPDGEAKLGQPMINLALIRDWGTVDLFLLPYFRERSFAGEKGRLRTHPRVAVDQVQYESKDDERNLDYALRWVHSLDVWDLGLSYFYGTSRDPSFSLSSVNGEAVLIPQYDIIHQIGVDAQATVGAWLWKLEAINRHHDADDYSAITAGFEYSFYGVFETVYDLGVIYEYLYDSRGSKSTSPFADDSMLGMRLAFNDEASTDVLLGVIVDHAGEGHAINLEASRRFGEHWKLNLKARGYVNIAPNNPLYHFRQDGYAQMEWLYYF